jgi:hypothetical protein
LRAAFPRAGRRRARASRKAKGAGEVVRRASVPVVEAPHLCRVQAATRELCRSIGADEGDVFSAVIAVTELAHRLFIEGSRPGAVELAIVRRRNEVRLVARPGGTGDAGPAGVNLLLPAALP